MLLQATYDRTVQICNENQFCYTQTIPAHAFNYTTQDQIADNCNTSTNCVRLAGGVMFVSGAVGTATTGAATGATCAETFGATCVLGVFATTALYDVTTAGYKQMASGQTVIPAGEQVLQSLGLSPLQASALYGEITFLASPAAGVTRAGAQLGSDVSATARVGSEEIDAANTLFSGQRQVAGPAAEGISSVE